MTTRSLPLDGLRLAACAGVVAIHVYAPVLARAEMNFAWWEANLLTALSRWSVPVFVMLAGYLAFERYASLNAAQKSAFLHMRWRRLGVPLLFWSAIYLLLTHFLITPLSPGEALEKLGSGIPFYHLYFLYVMLGLALFTPLFSRLMLRLTPHQNWMMIGVIYLMLAGEKAYSAFSDTPFFEPNAFTFWIRFLPFYLFGHAARFLPPPSQGLMVGAIAAIVASGLLHYGMATSDPGNSYAFAYLNPLVTLSACCVFLWGIHLPGRTASATLSRIAEATLGIYLIHPLILFVLEGLFPSLILLILTATIATFTVVALRYVAFFRAIMG